MMRNAVWMLLAVLIVMTACNTTEFPPEVSMNLRPEAVIYQITPLESYEGEPVSFAGYGKDTDGSVSAYQWQSDLDGELSASAQFETDALSIGVHTISFQVRDDKGQWSEQVLVEISVIERPPPPQIEYFRASPGRIGTGDTSELSWYVTGAAIVYLNEGIGNVPPHGTVRVSPSINTEYTLTASGEGGSSEADTNILVVPARVGLPVINSFEASPGNIAIMDSAELSWDVANADLVVIDPGVGAADPVGSVTISPRLTTLYTLTAYNGIGLTTATTQVLVSLSAGAGSADLKITGIARIASEEGMLIEYTIANQGENDAPQSTTRLFANGLFRTHDSPGSIPAGASVTRQIGSWLYDPSTSVIKIEADADHVVAESNEANNSKTVFFPVRTDYDFIEHAADALWNGAYPLRLLVFGETEIEENGLVAYSGDAVLEDSSGPGMFLLTRPRPTFGGWIVGEYSPGIAIEPGCHFYALVGLERGAFAGDVTFRFYIREDPLAEWSELSEGTYDWYDYRIKPMVLPVPPRYYGTPAQFSLRVSTNGEPLQDWGVWVQAKLIR